MDYELNEKRVLSEMIGEMQSEVKELDYLLKERKIEMKECLEKDLMIGLHSKSEQYMELSYKKAILQQRIDLLRKIKNN
jgi:hypothetical protein